MDWSKLFNSPWFSGLVSGITVAVINYIFARKKTSAEIEKLSAESEKIRLEAEKLRKELVSSVENIASIDYQLSNKGEKVLYDSRTRGDIGYDFKGEGNSIYQNVNGKDVPVTPKGTGSVTYDKAGFSIQRTNTEGRYEVWLQTYLCDEKTKPFIPKNDLLEGKRRIKISFDVKVSGGSHTLKFVFKGNESKKWLGTVERKFSNENWDSQELYASVNPSENCLLRMDAMEATHAPSSIQIRNFVLTEKVNG